MSIENFNTFVIDTIQFITDSTVLFIKFLFNIAIITFFLVMQCVSLPFILLERCCSYLNYGLSSFIDVINSVCNLPVKIFLGIFIFLPLAIIKSFLTCINMSIKFFGQMIMRINSLVSKLISPDYEDLNSFYSLFTYEMRNPNLQYTSPITSFEKLSYYFDNLSAYLNQFTLINQLFDPQTYKFDLFDGVINKLFAFLQYNFLSPLSNLINTILAYVIAYITNYDIKSSLFFSLYCLVIIPIILFTQVIRIIFCFEDDENNHKSILFTCFNVIGKDALTILIATVGEVCILPICLMYACKDCFETLFTDLFFESTGSSNDVSLSLDDSRTSSVDLLEGELHKSKGIRGQDLHAFLDEYQDDGYQNN